MAFILSYLNNGYWVKGSNHLHEQIIITDEDQMIMNYHWVSLYLPGIY
jgi:hypothetical protein